MSPADQARFLAPLRAAVNALGDIGKRTGSAGYTGVAIDANHHAVDLYVTDTAKAQQLIRAAKKADGSIDTRLIRVHRAAHSMVELYAARDSFTAQPHSYAVYAVGVAQDGSGLTVEVPNPPAAQREQRATAATARPAHAAPTAAAVNVSFVKGTARTAKSWNDVKWHDHAPFIGGDVITPDGHHYCTTGLPAVRTSDNHPLMVVAAHCFAVGTKLYSAGGPTWGFGNGQIGDSIGQVTARNNTWDAATVDGADNNADESDTTKWLPLTRVKYSYVGDFVCHSGFKSAYFGHPTPCGIKVTNSDLWFPVAGYTARGVEGVDVNGWGSVNGDSGGTVFASFDSSNNREARGMVSSGGADGTPDQARVDWGEAVDILKAFGLKLNPKT